MSSIINKSKFIVTVKRRPDLNRAFPHHKGTEAKAYKQQLLSEDKLVADIARGPLKLFVRIRTRGRPHRNRRNVRSLKYRLRIHRRTSLDRWDVSSYPRLQCSEPSAIPLLLSYPSGGVLTRFA